MKSLLLALAIVITAGFNIKAAAPGKVKVYLFIQTQCPCIYSHKETFGKLLKTYRSQVEFTAVFSDSNDSDKDIQDLMLDLGWKMPYVKDTRHRLLMQLHPRVSTDVVLLDAAGKVLYKGAIDDGPSNMGMVKHFYLQDALEACLKHLPVPVSSAPGRGCLLQY
jgi:hypothetical protein